MGLSLGEEGLVEIFVSIIFVKLGFFFSFGKKKGVNVVQFGVKFKFVKIIVFVFVELSSEEEEDEVQEEDIRVLFDNE